MQILTEKPHIALMFLTVVYAKQVMLINCFTDSIKVSEQV